jgi:hypothetical protein
MLMLVPLLVAAGCVPLLGGDLRRVANLRFRHLWLLLGALATQVWLIARPGPQTVFLTTLELGAYPLALAFLYVNRRIAGTSLMALGAGSNFVAIAANGGVMPQARSAAIIAGMPLNYHGIYANSAPIPHPHLFWLGDVFPVPAAVPFATVFSIGDFLIMAGAVVALLRITLAESPSLDTEGPAPMPGASNDPPSTERQESGSRVA